MVHETPPPAIGTTAPGVSELLKQIARCEEDLSAAVHKADALEGALGTSAWAVIICEAAGFRISYVNDVARRDLEAVHDRMEVSPQRLVGQPLRVLDDIVTIDRRRLDGGDELPISGEIDLAGERRAVLAVALKDKNGGYLGSILTWPEASAQASGG